MISRGFVSVLNMYIYVGEEWNRWMRKCVITQKKCFYKYQDNNLRIKNILKKKPDFVYDKI